MGVKLLWKVTAVIVVALALAGPVWAQPRPIKIDMPDGGGDSAYKTPQMQVLNKEQVEGLKGGASLGTLMYAAESEGSGVVGRAIGALICEFLGGCPTGVAAADGGVEVGRSKGAIRSISRMNVAMVTNRPASTETYVADLLNNAGIGVVSPAYAQGIGFAALSPILEAWKTFRNIAYLFFILITLVIGFMIMFRQKVGSAAITAQQAIPQIIIALLAVTFSYAIAGLLIDAMYLLMFLMAGVFGYQDSFNVGIVGLGVKLITNGAGDAGSAIEKIVDNALQGTPVINAIDGALGGIPGEAVSQGAGLIALLTVAIAMFYATFKLFFELLKTYVTIIISITMAPLLLMFDAIPGRNGFSTWIKSLIGNLAAFPTVLMVLLIYEQLTKAGSGVAKGGFAPPYLLSGITNQAEIIPFLVGLGILLALPEAVVKVKSMLGASEGPFGEILKAGLQNARSSLSTGTKAAVVPVLGAAGAGGGYYAGGMVADRLGMKGQQKTTARLLGAGLGATMGPRIPGVARNVVGSTLRQARDAVIAEQLKRVMSGFDSAVNESETQEGVSLARGQKQVTYTAAQVPAGTPTQLASRYKRGARPPQGGGH
jgi:hypothetical protein